MQRDDPGDVGLTARFEHQRLDAEPSPPRRTATLLPRGLWRRGLRRIGTRRSKNIGGRRASHGRHVRVQVGIVILVGAVVAVVSTGVRLWGHHGGPPAMPQSAPAGFVRDFAEDFNVPAPLGTFAKVYHNRFAPGYDGMHDTSGKGTYDSAKVLSVRDGSLFWSLHTEGGNPLVANPIPSNAAGDDYRFLTYGQWSTAIKTSATGPGYKLAFLLWPESGQWTSEVDFPESDSIPGPVKAVSLVPGSPQTSTGPKFVGVTDSRSQLGDGKWHTYQLTWTPTSMTASIDGRVVERFPASVIPHQPMRVTLQAETSIDSERVPASSMATIQMAWVVMNKLAERPGTS